MNTALEGDSALRLCSHLGGYFEQVEKSNSGLDFALKDLAARTQSSISESLCEYGRHYFEQTGSSGTICECSLLILELKFLVG